MILPWAISAYACCSMTKRPSPFVPQEPVDEAVTLADHAGGGRLNQFHRATGREPGTEDHIVDHPGGGSPSQVWLGVMARKSTRSANIAHAVVNFATGAASADISSNLAWGFDLRSVGTGGSRLRCRSFGR